MLVLVKLHRSCRQTVFKMLFNFFQKLNLCKKFFVSSLGHFARTLNSSFDKLDIRKNELKIYSLGISCGVDGTVYMYDIFIVKASYHMDNRIRFSYVCKKFVSESFAFACAFYKSCDVKKLNGRGCDFFGSVHFFQNVKPFVGNGDNSHVGFDCTKRIICAFGA